MNKLILTLGIIISLTIFCSTQVLAVCDYSNKCAPKAYDMSPHGCQVTSKATGMTFLTEKIAQSIIKRELKKATKEKFKDMCRYMPCFFIWIFFKEY